jgi:hypothetical protein
VLAAPLGHVLRKIIKVESGKGIHFMFGPELTVIRAAGGTAADSEGLAPKCAVRCGFQHLDADRLLVGIVLPRQLAEAAAWSGVRIPGGCCQRETGLETEQHRRRDHEHSLEHKSSSFVKKLSYRPCLRLIGDT